MLFVLVVRGNLDAREQFIQPTENHRQFVFRSRSGRLFELRRGTGQLIEAGCTAGTFDPVRGFGDRFEIAFSGSGTRSLQSLFQLKDELVNDFAKLGVVGRQS